MEGHLTYTIDGVERKMFFGNYALEETLNHFDYSISDIDVLLNTKLLQLIRVFTFHAAAYPILKEGGQPEFTEFDIHEWIDKSGGSSGDLVVKISKELFRCLGLKGDDKPQKKSKSKS